MLPIAKKRRFRRFAALLYTMDRQIIGYKKTSEIYVPGRAQLRYAFNIIRMRSRRDTNQENTWTCRVMSLKRAFIYRRLKQLRKDGLLTGKKKRATFIYSRSL